VPLEGTASFKAVLAHLSSDKADEKAKGEELRLESLKHAADAYVELAQKIRDGAPGEKPRVILMWLSECPIEGCLAIGKYPHYYVGPKWYDINKIDPPDGFVNGSSVIGELGKAMGAEVVDASYADVLPSTPMAIDACAACKNEAKGVCDIGKFRLESAEEDRLCGAEAGSGCGSITRGGYPDDAAHTNAADLLDLLLKRGSASEKKD
jgi:hypothetical protein